MPRENTHGPSEERPRRERTREERPQDDATVYIGKNELMNYVLAVVTRFGNGADEVRLKARGRSISTAVDVAEIVRNRHVTDAKVKDIRIATEQLTNEEGRTSNVSSIEIILAK